MAAKNSKTKKVDPIVEATEKAQAKINAIPHDPMLDSIPTHTAILMNIDDKLGRILELLEMSKPIDVSKWYK